MRASGYSGLHAFWRRLPLQRRQQLFDRLTGALAPRPSLPGAVVRGAPPFTLAGALSSSIGIGWGLRAQISLLEKAGWPVRAVDLSSLLCTRDLPAPGSALPAPRPEEGGTLLLHVNPNLLPYAYLRLGRGLVKGRYVIGYWVWELPTLPESWVRHLDLVHEIWTPSRFCADAFRGHGEKAIRVMPHIVDPPPQVRADRARFGLPEDVFVVLTMAHLSSGLTRKNPIGAIRAFKRAFGESRDVRLVIKLSQRALYPGRFAAIVAEVDGAPNITVMDETLGDAELWRLLASADVLLSLHRAEGFGLVLAQAMALGKCVIATGWSGNMEFMNGGNALLVPYRLTPVKDAESNYAAGDAVWAEPSLDKAAGRLREVYRNHACREAIGEAAKRDVGRLLSSEAALHRLRCWESGVGE